MQSSILYGIILCLAKAGLTGLSGAATTFTTGSAVTYSIGGKAYSKATVAGGATPVVDFNTNAAIVIQPGKGTVVVWCLDAAGNVRAVQGSAENIDANGLFLTSAPQFPSSIPDTLCPFAYSLHKVLPAGAAFTFGVTAWNTANTVHTAQDVIALPQRPQTV